MSVADESLIAVFVDFENLALGVKDMHQGEFKIQLVLKRLLEKGRLVFKRAYCDWTGYGHAVREFHGHGIELIDVPHTRQSGKNSADIRMVVDALDLCYQRDHITAFALITGDSDFSPLVNKLNEYNKYIIGIGVKNSTSELLVSVCDEFIFYEDLVREKTRLRQHQPRPVPVPFAQPAASSAGGGGGGAPPVSAPQGEGGRQEELVELVMDAFAALQRENYDHVWGSMIKQQIKRKKPQFTEAYFGFRNFSDVLDSMKRAGLVDLKRDPRSGAYEVFDLGAGGGGGSPANGGGERSAAGSGMTAAAPASGPVASPGSPSPAVPEFGPMGEPLS